MDPDPANILITLFFVFFTLLFQLCDEAFALTGEARIRELEEDGSRNARVIRRMTENAQRFSMRVRVSTIFGATGIAYCLNRLFGKALYSWLMSTVNDYIGGIATLLAVYLLLTIFTTVVFGAFCCMFSTMAVPCCFCNCKVPSPTW